MAVACGLLWGLIGNLIPFFYLNLVLAAGVGYAIGGVISRSVNRKRGTGLAVVAGIAVVLSYLINIFALGGAGFWLFDLLALALGIFIAVNALR
jgi:threonine/homoserine/homoserine lactone efflux protein